MIPLVPSMLTDLKKQSGSNFPDDGRDTYQIARTLGQNLAWRTSAETAYTKASLIHDHTYHAVACAA